MERSHSFPPLPRSKRGEAGQGSSSPRRMRGLAPQNAGCAVNMYYVYILHSLKDNGFYIGCTSDLDKRLKTHNCGKTLSLRNRKPLKIIHIETYKDPINAYKREKQIKSYKGGEAFKKLIEKYGEVA